MGNKHSTTKLRKQYERDYAQRHDRTWRRRAEGISAEHHSKEAEIQETLVVLDSAISSMLIGHFLPDRARILLVGIRSSWDDATRKLQTIQSRLEEEDFCELEARILTIEYYSIFDRVSKQVTSVRANLWYSIAAAERNRDLRPLPTVQQTRLEPMHFKDLPENHDNDEEEFCPICTDNYSEEKAILKCPDCRNYMHGECILRWLRANMECPLCRETLR